MSISPSLPSPAPSGSPSQQSEAAPSTPVSAQGGAVSVTATSMTATVKSILETANEIGGFWNKWGVSASLFTLGTFAIIVAFISHAVGAKGWNDDSFFAALAFALAIFILGFVAFADKQNRSGENGKQAVTIYQITVDASLEGQRIAAQERNAARPPTPQPGPPGMQG